MSNWERKSLLPYWPMEKYSSNQSYFHITLITNTCMRRRREIITFPVPGNKKGNQNQDRRNCEPRNIHAQIFHGGGRQCLLACNSHHISSMDSDMTYSTIAVWLLKRLFTNMYVNGNKEQSSIAIEKLHDPACYNCTDGRATSTTISIYGFQYYPDE